MTYTRIQRAIASLLLVCASTAWGQAAESPYRSALNGELFYIILEAELTAARGDPLAASQRLLYSARYVRAPELFKRSMELALQARNTEAAILSANEWVYALPDSLEANRSLLELLLQTGRIADSAEPLRRTIAALSPQEKTSFIIQLPSFFVRVTDKKLAASILEQALSNELSSRSTGATAWAALGIMRLLANDAAGALQCAQNGHQLNPQANEPMILAVNLPAPHWQTAEPWIQTYLAQKNTADIRIAYIQKLLSVNRTQDAYREVQTLTTKNPELPEAWLQRGALEFQFNQYNAAQPSLTTYVNNKKPNNTGELDRGLVQAYLMLADIAIRQQQYSLATEYLDRIKTPADSLRVQSRRAHMLAKQGKLADARALLRKAPTSNADEVLTKTKLEAELLRDHKQYAEAYQLLHKAAAQYPDDIELSYTLSTLAEKTGNVQEMEQRLRAIIAKRPDFHAAYNALGYSMADRNVNLSEARQLIQKALEFAPQDPYIIDSLGWVEYRSGNLAEARRLLEQAFAAAPQAEIAAHLGEVLWHSGAQSQAREIWKQGQALDPQDETLRSTIKRLAPGL